MKGNETIQDWVFQTFKEGKWIYYFDSGFSFKFLFVTKGNDELAAMYFPDSNTLTLNIDSEFLRTYIRSVSVKPIATGGDKTFFSETFFSIADIKEAFIKSYGFKLASIYSTHLSLSAKDYDKSYLTG